MPSAVESLHPDDSRIASVSRRIVDVRTHLEGTHLVYEQNVEYVCHDREGRMIGVLDELRHPDVTTAEQP